MSLRWDEVEKSAKENQAKQSSTRRLFLETGEPTDIRFIGLENDEPFIYKRHFDGKTKKYINCAEDHAKAGEHEGCVACAIAQSMRGKDARLKSPQRLYAVSVFDPRKQHFVEKLEGNERYQPCADDETCKWCRRGIERTINGVRHWSLAEGLVLQLRTFERDVLGKQCARDGGRIKVTGYVCPTCENELEPDGDPTEEMRCRDCEKEQGKKPIQVVPKPVITCKTCGPKGRRLTLADAWVSVIKNGQKKNTTYNFSVGEIEPFDPDVYLKEFPKLKKIKPVVFEGHPDFEPPSAGEMAILLGVDNPFGKSSKKRRDPDEDDDEDDDDEVEFKSKKKKPVDEDDEDDDDPPKKKKKPVDDEDEDDEDDEPKKKKKRPADDDDDEEDDIFS
jgi:hypothetical protein